MICFTKLLSLFAILCYFCQISYQRVDDSQEWEESDQIHVRTQSRRFYHTEEELELTKVDPKIDNKPCNDMHSLSVFIHSAGRSNGKYFDRRQVVRNTWVKELKELNVSVYFVIALNVNQTINEELEEESDRHQDMIQFSFIDAYYNLTLKTISILRWVNKKCLTSTHILKIDDDAVVNSPLLLEKLSDFKTGIYGFTQSNHRVNRDPNNFEKYTPFECFPNKTYPTYAYGGAYMMSSNISHTLVEFVDEYPYCVIQIEDVFIGIIAEMAGIPVFRSPLIGFVGCGSVCPLFNTAVIYQCKTPNQTEEFWSEWKTTSYEFCRNVYYIQRVLITLVVVVIIGFVLTGLTFGAKYLFNKN